MVRDLGDAARDRRDWGPAATHYADYLASQPLDFAIWVQLGHMLKELGRYDEAEFAYQQANELNSRDPDLWLNRGHLAKLRRDFHAAIDYYSQSFDLKQDDDAQRELIALGTIPFDENSPLGLHSSLQSHHLSNVSVGNVERIDSTTVYGWVMDSATSAASVDIVVLRDGEVVGSGRSIADPPESLDFRWPTGTRPFVIPLNNRVRLGDVLSVHLAGEKQPLTNSPLKVEPSHRARAWLARHDHLSKDQIERKRAAFTRETLGLKLSILMPIVSEEPERLKQVVGSVAQQWCPHWELICVYDGSSDAISKAISQLSIPEDARVTFLRAANKERLVATFREGLDRASGDYVAMFQTQAFLEPEAVFRILDATKSGPDLLYSDEMHSAEDYNDIRDFIARPSFSFDHFTSTEDLGVFIAIKSDRLDRENLQQKDSASQIVLEATHQALECSKYVAHIPGFIVRSNPAEFHRDKPEPRPAPNGLRKHTVAESNGMATLDTSFDLSRKQEVQIDIGRGVLVIIPTRDGGSLLKACVESIRSTIISKDVKIVVVDNDSEDPKTLEYIESFREAVVVARYPGDFNYAKMHNDVVRDHSDGQDFVLFVNDDVEAIDAGWMERMRSLASRPDVGGVGATLLYSDRRVQHAGVVLGVGGLASHAHRYLDFERFGKRNPGPSRSLVSTREYLAVTGACMMMKLDAFLGVGGFDEDLVIDYNDIDLCLRIGSLGYKVLNDADVVLHHHESATRGTAPRKSTHIEAGLFARRWKERLAAGDPFYNPLLSMIDDHSLGQFLEMYHPIRVTDLRPALRPYADGRPRQVAGPSHYPGLE